jgi:biopolymer transport protein ExbD
MLATWPELDTRILSFELNVPVEEVERLLPRPSSPVVDVVRRNTVIPVQRLSADAGRVASVVTVSLGVDANGRARTWVDSDPPEVLPAKIDISSFAAIATNAKKRAATQVVIAVDERTTHSQVVALIDALQKVGFTHITIQLRPSAERQSTTKPWRENAGGCSLRAWE